MRGLDEEVTFERCLSERYFWFDALGMLRGAVVLQLSPVGEECDGMYGVVGLSSRFGWLVLGYGAVIGGLVADTLETPRLRSGFLHFAFRQNEETFIIPEDFWLNFGRRVQSYIP